MDSLREITRYGTVIMLTVGQIAKKGPVYATKESLTLLTLRDEQYMLDLLTGSLEVWLTWGGTMRYFFTSNFISTLENNFKNSIVYFESDVSSELATSFLGKEVHTFFGFSGDSEDAWKTGVSEQLFTLMVKDGKDTGKAYADLPKRNEGNSYFLKYSNSTAEVGYKREGCYLLEWVDTDFPPSAYPPPYRGIDYYWNANEIHYKVDAQGGDQDLFVYIYSYSSDRSESEWSLQAKGLRDLAAQLGAELLKNDNVYIVPGYKSTHKDGGYSPGTWALRFYKGNIIQVMSYRCYVVYNGNRYDTNCTDSRIPGLSKEQLLARYDHEVQIAIGIIDARCSQNGCID